MKADDLLFNDQTKSLLTTEDRNLDFKLFEEKNKDPGTLSFHLSSRTREREREREREIKEKDWDAHENTFGLGSSRTALFLTIFGEVFIEGS